jgi:hypothetical protein
MLKVADTKEKYQACLDYLEVKSSSNILYGTVLLYIENANKITGVAGWNFETGSIIEPFKTDNKFVSSKLWDYMKVFLLAKGFQTISVITNDEKLTEYLRSDGFILYNTGVNHFIKLAIGQ